jgi:hypothetical protein
MTTGADLKLKCLELAFAQARLEGFAGDRNKIGEIHTWIYNRCIEGLEPAVPEQGKKAKADKAPSIFE